ncbi:ZIP family metal transporter [Candidatus Woesearchaeota archaeon]|jgi:zinc and cadmium transporter|nr:ZIP family metal transporter [Candidatus Woesearchaeota archaeon]|tara:strand:- start:12221 stop:12964 length:744 start_codon:yes stop_codon:yes gene_type:complete
MAVLLNILIAVFIVSLVSVLGILIFIRKKILNKFLFYIVSFAAGSLLGAAFLDLLPEALESGYNESIPIYILIGILSFFILEKFLHWHHHHTHEKETHAFTYLNIIGDGVHNFLDGAIIAVSFINSTALGIVTTIAIIAHEIPQEISDFAVLIYGGFSKTKALVYNFLTALTAFIGALVAFFYSGLIENSETFLLTVAVGFFIYIASTDLIPEIHKEKDLKKSFVQFVFLVFGIFFIWVIGIIFGQV